MTRSEAKAAGLKTYDGTPCTAGHVQRYTSNGKCVECELEYQRIYRDTNKNDLAELSRRYREANMEKTLEYERRYREENKEIILERKRRYYAANKETLLEQHRRYYNKNREMLAERVRQWQKQNPEAVRAIQHNRRARKRAAGGTHTAADVLDLLQQQKGRCANCKTSLKKVGYHVDHIMPLVLGGDNSRYNLQILCPTCNLRKNAAHPIEFAQRNGKLL